MPTDLADELSRLAQLHNAGHLTDAEYAAAKGKLLGTQTSDEPNPSDDDDLDLSEYSSEQTSPLLAAFDRLQLNADTVSLPGRFDIPVSSVQGIDINFIRPSGAFLGCGPLLLFAAPVVIMAVTSPYGAMSGLEQGIAMGGRNFGLKLLASAGVALLSTFWYFWATKTILAVRHTGGEHKEMIKGDARSQARAFVKAWRALVPGQETS